MRHILSDSTSFLSAFAAQGTLLVDSVQGFDPIRRDRVEILILWGTDGVQNFRAIFCELCVFIIVMHTT